MFTISLKWAQPQHSQLAGPQAPLQMHQIALERKERRAQAMGSKGRTMKEGEWRAKGVWNAECQWLFKHSVRNVNIKRVDLAHPEAAISPQWHCNTINIIYRSVGSFTTTVRRFPLSGASARPLHPERAGVRWITIHMSSLSAIWIRDSRKNPSCWALKVHISITTDTVSH